MLAKSWKDPLDDLIENTGRPQIKNKYFRQIHVVDRNVKTKLYSALRLKPFILLSKNKYLFS